MSNESLQPCARTSAQESARRSRPSWIGRTLFALVVAICVGLWGSGNWLVWKRVEPLAHPQTSGEFSLDGLAASVRIARDVRGVPHVEAESERDAWATLGFVHAQDRLSQMLWLRRLARGRTAEVVGEAGLEADRLARTIGIGRLADAEARTLPQELRSLLDAYAVGVNARIGRVRADRPDPQHEPMDPWTAGDSIAIGKLLAWAASPDPQTQLVLEAMLERLGSVGARPFFPTGAGVQGVSIPFDLPEPETETVDRERSEERRARAVALSSVSLDATAWAVLPRATAQGAPLLAVDFRLEPTAPALLYEAVVTGGALRIGGLSVPGLPVFWAGRNAEVAWAVRPASVVTADLYRERVKPATADETGVGFYLRGRRWLPLEVREERIRVRRLEGDVHEVRLSVYSTRHGPLLDADALFDGLPDERPAVAIRWTGFEPGNAIEGLHAVAHASDARDVRRALARHHEPVVSVLYADRRGEVGIQTAGWLPRKMLPTGVLPVNGAKLGFDWQRRLDYDDMPATHFAARKNRDTPAHVAIADEAATAGFGTGGIEWLWRTGRDAEPLDRRLRELSEQGAVDADQLAALQRSLHAEVAASVREAVSRLAGPAEALGSEARETLRMIEAWDGGLRPGSRGATVFRAFEDHLLHELFAAEVGPDLLGRYLALDHARPDALVAAVLLAAAGPGEPGGWSEPQRVSGAVKTSLLRASRSLVLTFGPDRDRWVWSEAHPIRFAALPAVAAGVSGSSPHPFPFEVDGAPALAAEGAGFVRFRADEPFRIDALTTARLLVDLADDHSLASMLMPGQSEHRDHAHFADRLPAWQTGQHHRVAMRPIDAGEATFERMVLRPGR